MLISLSILFRKLINWERKSNFNNYIIEIQL